MNSSQTGQGTKVADSFTCRNYPMNQFTLTDERRDEIQSKLTTLSSQSTYLAKMSYEEQLQIVREIKNQIYSKKWHYSYDDEEGKINKTPYVDYEAALLQMAPLPVKGQKIINEVEVNKLKSYSKFTVTMLGLQALSVYEDRLNHLIREKEHGIDPSPPSIYRDVTPLFEENILHKRSDTEQVFVHDKRFMPLILSTFEVWTRTNNKYYESNVEQLKRINVSDRY